MNVLKRLLGILWVALALLAAYYCIFYFGIPKLISGKTDDLVFGIIVVYILTPLISIGLGIFGVYSLLGEYDD